MTKNNDLHKFVFNIFEFKTPNGNMDDQTYMKNERVPEEMVITQLRAMVRYFEKRYFKDFDASLSTTAKE